MQEAHDSYNASMVWEIANGSPSERDAGVARVASWVRAWNASFHIGETRPAVCTSVDDSCHTCK